MFQRKLHMRPVQTLIAALATLLSLAGAAAAVDGRGEAGFLPLKKAAAAPEGAASLCRTYDWACAGATNAAPVGADMVKLAAQVNRAANAAIRPITDQKQYAVAERWSLPSQRGGDCEDYALFKKQALIAVGISADRLLVAVALDRKRQVHAVLILRSDMGDFVLDNMTNRVLGWNQTGYTFLRMQDPRQPSRWVSTFVQAGGGLNS
jgi:predicted transglutaminase-like cysteine proteinase